jgi:diguanylate cyclase (GGDEF)-like protein
VDDLTGLPDWTEFHGALATFASDKRGVLVLFDVDDLLVLNGRHGHKEVDRLLARLGSVIQERCGPGELAARIGGDEFALILFEEHVTEVVREVGRIRRRFTEGSPALTLSVGIAEVARLQRHLGSPDLFLAADDALTDAKKEKPAG